MAFFNTFYINLYIYIIVFIFCGIYSNVFAWYQTELPTHYTISIFSKVSGVGEFEGLEQGECCM